VEWALGLLVRTGITFRVDITNRISHCALSFLDMMDQAAEVNTRTNCFVACRILAGSGFQTGKTASDLLANSPPSSEKDLRPLFECLVTWQFLTAGAVIKDLGLYLVSRLRRQRQSGHFHETTYDLFSLEFPRMKFQHRHHLSPNS
jgi:hypothetical protein